jgi:voltage-gated potassium channel
VGTGEHPRKRPLRYPLRRHALKALPRALAYIALGTLTVVTLSGVVIWVVDPTNFPNPWLGMWWALQTVTTVGYGDVVPETVAGRIYAGVIMIVGVAIVSILTATVVAGISRRALEEERAEERRELRAVLRRFEERLDRIDRKLS